MEKAFTDKLMDIQESLIALCLEFAEGRAEKIFAFVEIRPKCRSFNAFFLSNGKILDNVQMANQDLEYVIQFLNEGMKDAANLASLFSECNAEAPAETKMTYDVKTNFFSANYRYANQIPEIQNHTYNSHYTLEKWEKELKTKYEK